MRQFRSGFKRLKNVLFEKFPESAFTFAMMAPAMARKGVNPRRTRVRRYSWVKPMMNPAKKVDTHWMKRESLSPIPSWIFSMSLRTDGRERERKRHHRIIIK